MNIAKKFVCEVVCTAVALCAVNAQTNVPPAVSSAPSEPVDAEVVFVLDTTGSMTGLIEGAKQKIWSIAGGIIQRTGGKVSIGLIPYRDRGDAYVTRLYPLTNNLDQVYADLQGFRAAGGGDVPESVNQALFEAVTKIQWSDSKSVMRTIFLVGDCPPHMDYKDDVKYPESCAMAARKNIVVNTVQCGGEPSTTPHWKEIARLTNGGYTQIGQTGNMRMIETPYDKEIQRINVEISKTILPYGSQTVQSSMRGLVKFNVGASAAVAASRNAVKAEAMAADALAAPVGGSDLTAEPEALEKMKVEDLPDELKNLSPEERKARLDEAVKKRRELNAQLLELNRKRSEYISESEAKSKPAGAKASFDEEVLRSIDSQLRQMRPSAK